MIGDPHVAGQFAIGAPLSPHLKKLLGAVLTLVWLVVYSLLAMGIGAHVLPHAGALPTFLYYLFAGTVWIIPVGLLLPWMYRQPHNRRS